MTVGGACLKLVEPDPWQEVSRMAHQALDEWLEGLKPLLERAERGGVRSIVACFARAVLLPCAAGLAEWAEFKEHYRWLKDFLKEREMYDGDIARMAEIAAELMMRTPVCSCWVLIILF